MSDVRVELNREGVRSLLRSAEMEGVVVEYASKIQRTAGAGYEQDSYKGRNRVNAMAYAETYQAKRDNLKHNTLLKATRGAGGG